MLRPAIVLLMLGTLTGCASTGGLRSQPLNAGAVRTFEADFAQTLKAAREAVIEAGLEFDSAEEISDGTYMIIAKKSASGFSWGELVRVTVFAEGAGRTRVNVVTQRRVATNVTARGDYSTAIFSNIELKLRGQPQPR